MSAPSRDLWIVDAPQAPMAGGRPRGNCITVIVPVLNNQHGIDRLLKSLATTTDATCGPAMVVIVDNGSHPPVLIRDEADLPFPVRVEREATLGPAAARNAGARVATTDWLLFLDSDCVASASTISGYESEEAGPVAFSGGVRALGQDPWSGYYEAQAILEPVQHEGRPAYVVTANALVWKPAFDIVGGFDTGFRLAAGEDIDLALRLRSIGVLSHCAESVVFHDFEEGFRPFWSRFVRYGRGNWWLADKYGYDLAPRPFRPRRSTWFNLAAAMTQFAGLSCGYHAARLTTLWHEMKSTAGSSR